MSQEVQEDTRGGCGLTWRSKITPFLPDTLACVTLQLLYLEHRSSTNEMRGRRLSRLKIPILKSQSDT